MNIALQLVGPVLGLKMGMRLQTVVNYCDNQLDGSGTATVGEVYDAAVKLFPTLATLDEAITADLSPLCEGKVGK